MCTAAKSGDTPLSTVYIEHCEYQMRDTDRVQNASLRRLVHIDAIMGIHIETIVPYEDHSLL